MRANEMSERSETVDRNPIWGDHLLGLYRIRISAQSRHHNSLILQCCQDLGHHAYA